MLSFEHLTRVVFFTGKGGVGKTSLACATAIALADRSKRVLLVSTDPASNLDDVFETKLSSSAQPIEKVRGLWAMNINPEQAAHDYREKIVAPYRGVLPKVAIDSIEEQLSGACTVEIAAFDEFAKLLGDLKETSQYDHIIFDTAPTGHTLRLLELPAAWTHFIDSNVGGTSCLGPLSGLGENKIIYSSAKSALSDKAQTTIVLVTRPETSSLKEAERTREELAQLGVKNVRLILNGVFRASNTEDRLARSFEKRRDYALNTMPNGLREIERDEMPLQPFEIIGVEALRSFGSKKVQSEPVDTKLENNHYPTLDTLIEKLSTKRTGVVMTMGKGGVGKSSIAAKIAISLAKKGCAVTLTTTDPAAHVEQAARDLGADAGLLTIERIDPAVETAKYTKDVLREAGQNLDEAGRALLEEDLRSPCTEEIAVFRAFAETVAQGENRIVVIDTAPTGHTLLLLDAAEAYHREVLRKPNASPKAVQDLLPRLRDREFTHILLITLAESTPIHEAMRLEQDLLRANIKPYAWVVNQALSPLVTNDSVLILRKKQEGKYLRLLEEHSPHFVVEPWSEMLAGSAA